MWNNNTTCTAWLLPRVPPVSSQTDWGVERYMLVNFTRVAQKPDGRYGRPWVIWRGRTSLWSNPSWLGLRTKWNPVAWNQGRVGDIRVLNHVGVCVSQSNHYSMVSGDTHQ